VVYCPKCKRELPNGVTECFVCGCDLTEAGESDWIVIGEIENKLYADFAKETLASCGIPAVIISNDGFFGSLGLPMRPFYNSQSAPFEISVPAVYCEEAIEILDMTVSDKWRRKES
jgi:hypothetical protein